MTECLVRNVFRCDQEKMNDLTKSHMYLVAVSVEMTFDRESYIWGGNISHQMSPSLFFFLEHLRVMAFRAKAIDFVKAIKQDQFINFKKTISK